MRVLITGASGGIGAACVQRFLDEGHEVVGFDLLPAAIEHERYRHLIVDVREPDSFPGDLEPQVIVNVAGTQDSADDIAANLRGTINVTEHYAFVGEGLAAKPTLAIKSVVNVGSASGHTGSEFPAYAASKGGGHRQQCGPGWRYHAAQPLRDGRRTPVEPDYGAYAA